MNRTLFFKSLTTLALIIAITLALGAVTSLVDERQQYQAQAVHQVAQSFAGEQRLIGPVLIVPYVERQEKIEKLSNGDEKRSLVDVPGEFTFFPKHQNLSGTLQAQKRRLGIYEVPVYELLAKSNGQMEVTIPEKKADSSNFRFVKKPYLSFVLGDSRGLVSMPKLSITDVSTITVQSTIADKSIIPTQETTPAMERNDAPQTPWTLLDSVANFSQGPSPDSKGDGVHILFGEFFRPGQTYRFKFTLDYALAGTERLSIVPIADDNRIELDSSWPHPLFSGNFLPRSRDIDANGFKAAWKIPSLASKAQAQYVSSKGSDSAAVEAISVSLVDPVNIYSKTDRATKYGFLFIVLTFAGFFIYELVKSARIHPIQYLLVGLGLVIFFLLLLSLSEHIPFAYAYLVASLACIGLLGYYLAHVLKRTMYGLGFAAMLTTLYGALYGLLISEDNALLLGSLLLFVVLAIVMIVTRRVDWYSAGSALSVREKRLADLD